MSPKSRKGSPSIDALMEKGLLHKGSDERFIIHRIPFGLPELDEIVSGGLPRNRISILTGEYCVAPETLIDTEAGRIPIKTIVEDRLPVRVWSLDVVSGQWQLKPILRWWKQPQKTGFSKLGSLCLTPEHEVWTQRGYIKAKEVKRFPSKYYMLKAGGKTFHEGYLFPLSEANSYPRLPSLEEIQDLYRLRQIQDSRPESSMLQLRCEMETSKHSGIHCQCDEFRDTSQTAEELYGDNERSFQETLGMAEEPWQRPSNSQAEGFGKAGTALEVGGSWEAKFVEAREASRGFRARMVQRVFGAHPLFPAMSTILQDRYCSSGVEDCHRGGESRQFSQGAMVQGEWVDTAMVLKQDGGGLHGGLSSDGFVYDLTVADNHNFIANSLLVSNSSGKSFLIQLIMKNALANDLQVAYIDTERSYDPKWWSQVGLDIDKIMVSQPPSGEDAIDVAEALAIEGFDIVAIDSLAGLVPVAEVEENAAKQFIAGQAKLVTRLMHKLVSANHKAAIVCTNQLRSSIGPGPIDHMPGGWAQKYFGHLLLRIYRESWLEERGGVRVGFNMKVVCRKSKVGRGYRECLLPFRFRGEIDRLAMLVDRALEAEMIVQKGPYYKILDGENIMGKNRVLELLGGDDALVHRLETALGDEHRPASEDSG